VTSPSDYAEQLENLIAGVGSEETPELLRTKGAAAARKLRGLRGDDLDKATSFGPAGGHPFSVEQFCIATVGHVQTHLSHAREAVGRHEAAP
jgi:hypothetical protein